MLINTFFAVNSFYQSNWNYNVFVSLMTNSASSCNKIQKFKPPLTPKNGSSKGKKFSKKKNP